MAYLAYLRKSRTDIEAEARGEGETLLRHRHILLELAKHMQLTVNNIYEEVVSGETISSRPQMQRLLSEVEQGLWEGVLVVEIERLARGDSIDQGIVAQAFKYSNTKIITPAKVYDPNNDFDEEYFEFGLFMSRREYKTIKRRMLAGRIASVKEGKYMGKIDPFGYLRVKLEHDKGYTLAIHPEQAEIVKNIFTWYLEGIGYSRIAGRLNACQVKTNHGLSWEAQQIRALLKNCLYCGYVTWGHKAAVKSVLNGQIKTSRKYVNDYIKQKGLHPSIVSEEVFEATQLRMQKFPQRRISKEKELRNPFQGILYCAQCAHKMQLTIDRRKGEPKYRIWCKYKSCSMGSCRITQLEEAIISALKTWLKNYETEISKQNATLYTRETEILMEKLHMLDKDQSITHTQLQRAYELVEQGIYSAEQFLTRQQALDAHLKDIVKMREIIAQQLAHIKQHIQAMETIISHTEYVLNAYFKAQSVQEKNDLLRSILDKVLYEKTGNLKNKNEESQIILHLYPLIPENSPHCI